ncbi:MAG: AF1514 family protein [Desulfatiglandales bacterium]
MKQCRTVRREALPNPVDVRIDREIDFNTARMLADDKVKETAGDPMLLAWYDSKSGRFSPNVTCCSEEKPGWIVYAESRGGDISIDINDETFVFIYRDIS